jgi:hypothetical protein
MFIRVPEASDEQVRQLRERVARGERLTAEQQSQVDTADARGRAFNGKDDGKLVTMRELVSRVD